MIQLIASKQFAYLNFRHYSHDPRLNPCIQCLWSTGGNQAPHQICEEKLYPDGGSSLTIKLSASGPAIYYVFDTSTTLHEFSSSDLCLGIRFKATGAFRLLGMEPLSFAEGFYQIGTDFQPQWFDSLMQVVEHCYLVSPDRGIALLESWLLDRLRSDSKSDHRLPKIVQAIEHHHPPPYQIADRLGFTRRTLERKFRREAGISPWQLVNYARMKKARKFLSTSTIPLPEIAQNCGYYDQAHFSHSFQKFSFETPAAYRQRKLSQFYKA